MPGLRAPSSHSTECGSGSDSEFGALTGAPLSLGSCLSAVLSGCPSVTAAQSIWIFTKPKNLQKDNVEK